VGDPGRLRQVLLNLLSNAVKFTGAGEIVIRLRTVRIQSAVELRLEVSDTGIGIRGEIKDKLFYPFVQADETATRQYGGTGLGLSISKRLVELMGGKIGMRPNSPNGTTFYFSVLVESRDQFTEPESEYSVLGGKTARVLVGRESLRRVVTDHLRSQGVNVVQDGEEAEANLVILDAWGPPEVQLAATELKKREPRAKVILLQPMGGAGTSGVDYSIADAQVSKPVRRAKLLRTAAQLMMGLSATATEPPRSVESRRGTGISILLVEDNPVNRLVVTKILEKLGYLVRCVNNGQEALDEAQSSRYDAILMDCQMPVMDGYEATRRIRALGGTNEKIPIIALTAHTSENERDKCIECGMDEYLRKPLRAEELTKILNRLAASN
jgi:CheY-like chemotaxis protein